MGGVYWGGIFPGGGMSKFSAGEKGLPPPHSLSRENRGGYTRMWLNLCIFWAGLQWTSSSYLPLLVLIFLSRKFKHFSSFSSSIVNWMYLPCLFKICWNSQDCSLDLNHARESSRYRLYVFGARLKKGWCFCKTFMSQITSITFR